MSVDMLVPLFVYQNLGTHLCGDCGDRLDGAHIVACGVQKNAAGTLCLMWEVICRRCRAETKLILDKYKITRPDWWNQIAAWHSQTAENDPNSNISPLAFMAPMPSIRLLLQYQCLERVQLFGGYKQEGESPLLLFRRCLKRLTYGVLRVEADDRVLLSGLPSWQCLPFSDWPWFCSLPEGATFTHAKREWLKLRESEIAGVVRDTVFRLIRKPQRRASDGAV